MRGTVVIRASRTFKSWRPSRRQTAIVFAAIGVACITQAAWIDIKAYVAQALIEGAWQRNQSTFPRGDARPWPWADTTPIARLTVLNGAPRGLTMPATFATPRGKSLFVLEGASGRNLAFGPTHDPASVQPGDIGNSVIAAHRDTHFRVLESLHIGDRVRIERTDGSLIHFAVTDIQIVDSRHTRIALDADTPRLTLVTCYPFNAISPGGPLRFVVTADLIAGAGHSPPPQVAHAAVSKLT